MSLIINRNNYIRLHDVVNDEDFEFLLSETYIEYRPAWNDKRHRRSWSENIESDANGRTNISVSSALGQNLLGHKIGDTIKYKNQDNNQEEFIVIGISIDGKEWFESEFDEVMDEKPNDVQKSKVESKPQVELFSPRYHLCQNRQDLYYADDVEIKMRFENSHYGRVPVQIILFDITKNRGIPVINESFMGNHAYVELQALNYALGRFYRPCRLTIYISDNKYLRSWVNKKTTTIVNVNKVLTQLSERISIHDYRFIYTEYQ